MCPRPIAFTHCVPLCGRLWCYCVLLSLSVISVVSFQSQSLSHLRRSKITLRKPLGLEVNLFVSEVFALKLDYPLTVCGIDFKIGQLQTQTFVSKMNQTFFIDSHRLLISLGLLSILPPLINEPSVSALSVAKFEYFVDCDKTKCYRYVVHME